jgi:rhamnosyltransferase
MNSGAVVTVLVPTRNAGAEFPKILSAIVGQRLDRPFEILIIDSGSTDGTVEFLRTQPVRLLEILPGEFDHGLTRALGIREARGEIVVLTVQDAQPFDDQWLQPLVDAFRETSVTGAYSRQIVRPDATPFARARLRGWHATGDIRRIQRIESSAAFAAAAPPDRLRQIVFDNVSSAVRRSVALEIPFRACRFGEDLDWSRRVLLAGHTIVYEPRSRVVHSHNRSMWYEFKRVYVDHQQLRRLIDLRTVPTLAAVVRRSAGGTLQLWREVAAIRPSAWPGG